MRENTDQNNFEYGHFLRSVCQEVDVSFMQLEKLRRLIGSEKCNEQETKIENEIENCE